MIGNAGGQRRGGSPACWSCVRSSPLNDPAAPARRRRHESARWMMPTKTYGNPRWHWAEGAPHCGRPCAQGRLRSPPGAGLTFTTRRRTALAQQVGRACPPAQSGARARCERHAIAVLSQGSNCTAARRAAQITAHARTRCRAQARADLRSGGAVATHGGTHRGDGGRCAWDAQCRRHERAAPWAAWARAAVPLSLETKGMRRRRAGKRITARHAATTWKNMHVCTRQL